ncbi:MAG: CBS domain-containing protein [Notoacmeibacter sp.]|nr:CBS domain-containing protein [Notoacmeibacter sp.]
MKHVTGATPLKLLNAVALDTETTGLDTKVARILQIGAMRINNGVVAENEIFDKLVDPGEPIPAASTAIHGINNAMVRTARPFGEVWRDTKAFYGHRLVIGYAIGFDLAVLEREAVRAGMRWVKPRTLCIRLLANLANPNLPNYSLEVISAWLGVQILNRHSALGDAEAAARIFLALVPKLQERGIRTLGEAERASLRIADLANGGDTSSAGWATPVLGTAEADRQRTFGQFDPYAYQHRVSDLMSKPPIIVRADMNLRAAVNMMTGQRISSIYVHKEGEPGHSITEYGILTERDVMRQIAESGADAFAHTVGELARRPLVSIRETAFAYRAMSRMDRLLIRHLAVRDNAGRLTGIVSSRDLLKLRASAAIKLDDAIETAADPDEMAAAWATLPSVIGLLVRENLDARLIAEITSEELRSLTRRAAQLAENEMEAEGNGRAPCAYCVLVLGSGGRGESLLAADQDNAIVFAKGDPDGPEDTWFAAMAEKMTHMLHHAGVPLCKGNVMASNPAFRGSLETWKHRIDSWVGRTTPEDLLNVDIFFDLLPVHGDLGLGHELFDYAWDIGKTHHALTHHMAANISDPASPFTVFGGFRTENGRLDIKAYGIFAIVAAARVLALSHGIRDHSTRARLEGLVEREIGNAGDIKSIMAAHSLLLGMMLFQQSRDLDAGLKPSNAVNIEMLDPGQKEALKGALKRIASVASMARGHI